MGRIVVGVDGSERSVEALRWAAREAERWGGTLQVVMTWDSPYPNMWLPSEPPGADHLAALRHQLEAVVHGVLGDPPPAETETVVADGPAAKVLIGLSGGADLLVVGNRGRGGFTGALLGSVGRQCVLHAACPVVVVRGPGRTGAHGGRRSEETESPEPAEVVRSLHAVPDPDAHRPDAHRPEVHRPEVHRLGAHPSSRRR